MHRAVGNTVEIDRTLVQGRVAAVPYLAVENYATPVYEMSRLRAALGGGARLLVKRDDLIPFGCGGNKVRKMEMVAARAVEAGADTLISTGGVQSNHARVVAAMAARLGMNCVIVVNGSPQADQPTGNARLMEHFGARVEYVAARNERAGRMLDIADDLMAQGRRPYIVPLGASTGLGALGFVRAMGELQAQVDPPDVIVLASSSGGTQAGLAAGCVVFGMDTRVMGVSADEAADDIAKVVRSLLVDTGEMLGVGRRFDELVASVHVDDAFIGSGYGARTPESEEAAALVAATEGLVLDPVYTAKAMAALIAYVRQGRFSEGQTVLFWHTGGLPGFLA